MNFTNGYWNLEYFGKLNLKPMLRSDELRSNYASTEISNCSAVVDNISVFISNMEVEEEVI